MLRNKITKPAASTTTNTAGQTQHLKNTQQKVLSNQFNNTSGLKMQQGVNFNSGPLNKEGTKLPSSGLGGGCKPTQNSVVKTQSIGKLNQAQITKMNAKTQQASNKTQNSQASLIAPQQIKSQQERLAQLVSKRAAQIKKQYQMINKISSQVAGDKKSYFKEYSSALGHVLKMTEQMNSDNKASIHQKIGSLKITQKDSQQSKRSSCLWKLNDWDKENHVAEYLGKNFQIATYM